MYIEPATPRLNGKVERSHRIDADEFYRLLDGVVLDDARLFTTKLQEWEDFYNFDRPARRLGRPNSLRATTPKDRGPCVIGHRQLHTSRLATLFIPTASEATRKARGLKTTVV